MVCPCAPLPLAGATPQQVLNVLTVLGFAPSLTAHKFESKPVSNLPPPSSIVERLNRAACDTYWHQAAGSGKEPISAATRGKTAFGMRASSLAQAFIHPQKVGSAGHHRTDAPSAYGWWHCGGAGNGEAQASSSAARGDVMSGSSGEGSPARSGTATATGHAGYPGHTGSRVRWSAMRGGSRVCLG